jgi:hypothetical protein
VNQLKSKVIRIYEDSYNTLKELCRLSGLDMADIVGQWLKAVQLALNGSKGDRVTVLSWLHDKPNRDPLDWNYDIITRIGYLKCGSIVIPIDPLAIAVKKDVTIKFVIVPEDRCQN